MARGGRGGRGVQPSVRYKNSCVRRGGTPFGRIRDIAPPKVFMALRDLRVLRVIPLFTDAVKLKSNPGRRPETNWVPRTALARGRGMTD